MNSRHLDPRRLWKGGPELRPMTPDPQNPGMRSRPPIPLQTSIEKSTSGPPGGSIFKAFVRKGLQGTPRRPKGAKESPRAFQGNPNRAKVSTKEGPMEPNGDPKDLKGSPWHPTENSQKAYTYKICRSSSPCGRYVNQVATKRHGWAQPANTLTAASQHNANICQS